MKTPEISEWDEFHDIEIVNWKRVRSAIEHENTLVNHRLTWLFTSQAFLFTAFTLAFSSWKTPPIEGKESIPYYCCIRRIYLPNDLEKLSTRRFTNQTP